MHNQIYPTDLTDRQWDCIKDLIPPAKAGGRPRTLDMRQVINAILYLVVAGIQWRMLPKEYPAWKSVYHYFRQWRDDGTWQRIHATLRAAVRRKAGRHKHPTAGCLDSQSIKTSQVPGVRGYDAGKNVNRRKRHILSHSIGVIYGSFVMADEQCGLHDKNSLELGRSGQVWPLKGQSIGQGEVTACGTYVLA